MESNNDCENDCKNMKNDMINGDVTNISKLTENQIIYLCNISCQFGEKITSSNINRLLDLIREVETFKFPKYKNGETEISNIYNLSRVCEFGIKINSEKSSTSTSLFENIDFTEFKIISSYKIGKTLVGAFADEGIYEILRKGGYFAKSVYLVPACMF